MDSVSDDNNDDDGGGNVDDNDAMVIVGDLELVAPASFVGMGLAGVVGGECDDDDGLWDD